MSLPDLINTLSDNNIDVILMIIGCIIIGLYFIGKVGNIETKDRTLNAHLIAGFSIILLAVLLMFHLELAALLSWNKSEIKNEAGIYLVRDMETCEYLEMDDLKIVEVQEASDKLNGFIYDYHGVLGEQLVSNNNSKIFKKNTKLHSKIVGICRLEL